MIQDDKELLLKNLCARLPYDVKCYIEFNDGEFYQERILTPIMIQDFKTEYLLIKPYLRPMSSMTEEEKKEIAIAFNYKWSHVNELDISSDELWKSIHEPLGFSSIRYIHMANVVDYLNSIHVDYRGLIPMGLAIEVTKENNPYEK